jgi:YVTN family beta-propeller protein
MCPAARATRDLSFHRVLAIALFALLQASAANADHLLVVNKSDNSLSVIAIGDGREIARITTGPEPHEVEVNASNTLAVVSNYGAPDDPIATLTAVDLETLEVSAIDLGTNTRPHGLAWLPDGRHLLVTTEGSQSVVLVDVEARKILAAIPVQGERPHMLVVDPTGRWAFVANMDSGSVSKLDLITRTVVATALTGEGTEGIALASDGRLWTAAGGDGSVGVFDAATLDRIASIDVGGMAIRVELVEDHGIALVTSAVGGRITAIDMKSLEVRNGVSTRWHWQNSSGRFFGGFFGVLPVPVGTQLIAAGDSFYVAKSFGGVVVEFSLPGFEVLRVVAAGHEPDGMAITSLSTRD